MSQEKYFASHRFFKVNGTFLPDCVSWPDMGRAKLTADVATDERFIFAIQTGMSKLEPYEFEFNKTKSITSAHRYLEQWEKDGDDRQVTIVETDAQGDPLDPRSVVGEFDLGKCQLGAVTYPGGTKESPTPGKVKAQILARQLKYRDLTT